VFRIMFNLVSSEPSQMKLQALPSQTSVRTVTQFPSLFRTHALPLPGGRFLRPRIGRGVGAERLRNMNCLWPQTRSIRELKQPSSRAHKRIIRTCEQSVCTTDSWQQARSQVVRVHDYSTAVTVCEPGLAMAIRYSRAIRCHDFSTPTYPAKILTSRKFQPATSRSRHRSVQPTTRPVVCPNRIQAIAYYEHV
jgi:hypothetical protein